MKIIVLTILLSYQVFAGGCEPQLRDIEYELDDRTEVQDLRIGRIRRLFKGEPVNKSATGFLISNKCILSAGHVFHSKEKYIIEFDVPKTNTVNLEYSKASEENTYYLDLKSRFSKVKVSSTWRYGKQDWAVVKVNSNNETKKYPGEVNGFFDLDFSKPNKKESILIKGYGAEKGVGYLNEYDKSATLQIRKGEVIDFDYYYKYNNQISYTAFTEAGDSGSPVIQNEKLIGIHTKGSCKKSNNSSLGFEQRNYGTLFYGNTKLIKAINNCLNEN